MKLTEEIANKVYNILEEIGAVPRMRDAFVRDHSSYSDQHEWRFQGKLGFGGKFWNEWSYLDDEPKWRVSCYSEDETPEREKIIEETNQKLRALAQTL